MSDRRRSLAKQRLDRAAPGLSGDGQALNEPKPDTPNPWQAAKVFEVHGTVAAFIKDGVLYFCSIRETGPESLFTIRVSVFGDEARAREFAASVLDNFKNNAVTVLEFEAERHLINITNFLLHELKILKMPLEEIIEDQAKQQRAILRARHHLQVGRGNFSQWGKIELRRAIQQIVTEKPDRTWRHIYKRLAQLHPDKAPASEGALKQLAKANGIKLRELKTEVAGERK